MGNLLRRYWHPVTTAIELSKEPVLSVKLLGENLALYKSPNGDLGLVAERCPHRGASMVYASRKTADFAVPITVGNSPMRACAWNSRPSLPRVPSSTECAFQPIPSRKWAA